MAVSIFFVKCQKMSTKTVQDTALMGEDVPFFVTLWRGSSSLSSWSSPLIILMKGTQKTELSKNDDDGELDKREWKVYREAPFHECVEWQCVLQLKMMLFTFSSIST